MQATKERLYGSMRGGVSPSTTTPTDDTPIHTKAEEYQPKSLVLNINVEPSKLINQII